MTRNNMKSDPSGVISAHRRTYIDVRTGTRRIQDVLVLEVIPVLIGVASFLLKVKLPTGASVGLLTVAGILSAFLFGVMLQVSERAMDWADSAPVPGPDTSAHATYLQELAANSGYASLICIITSAVFVVASVSSNLALRISTAIGLALALHMALILLMVMKRVYALTVERLNRARSGADRDRSSPPRRQAS